MNVPLSSHIVQSIYGVKRIGRICAVEEQIHLKPVRIFDRQSVQWSRVQSEYDAINGKVLAEYLSKFVWAVINVL